MSIAILAEINEKSTARIDSLKLTDETGAAITGTSLGTFTLTLYDRLTGTTINNRNAQDIKGTGTGANDVTIDANGNVVWTMRSADNVFVATDAPDVEDHVALFEWTWGSVPAKRSSREYVLRVKRVPKVSP